MYAKTKKWPIWHHKEYITFAKYLDMFSFCFLTELHIKSTGYKRMKFSYKLCTVKLFFQM